MPDKKQIMTSIVNTKSKRFCLQVSNPITLSRRGNDIETTKKFGNVICYLEFTSFFSFSGNILLLPKEVRYNTFHNLSLKCQNGKNETILHNKEV